MRAEGVSLRGYRRGHLEKMNTAKERERKGKWGITSILARSKDSGPTKGPSSINPKSMRKCEKNQSED